MPETLVKVKWLEYEKHVHAPNAMIYLKNQTMESKKLLFGHVALWPAKQGSSIVKVTS